MSKTSVSALNGARFEGETIVEDAGLCGMITLRGDPSDKGFAKALKSATGMAIPKKRTIQHSKDMGVAWMSSDEFLVLVPYENAEKISADLALGLSGQHALVSNVSDARALIRVSGPTAREVMAKLAPVDMASEQFQTSEIRRTRLAQIAAAFWMREDDTIELMCFRSVAAYAFDALVQASKNGAVGYFQSEASSG